MESKEKIVIDLIEKVLKIDLASNKEMNLINNGLDSIKVIQLIVLLEENLGIEFADEDLQMKYFVNLENIIQLIENKS